VEKEKESAVAFAEGVATKIVWVKTKKFIF
jgi:hypothetical protein